MGQGREGRLPAGASVVVLEDVVTTGQSALKAVERLSRRYSVNQVMALVDRQQPKLYQSAGLQFESVFSIQEIQERSRQLRVVVGEVLLLGTPADGFLCQELL